MELFTGNAGGGERQGDSRSSVWGHAESSVPGDGQVKMWNRQLNDQEGEPVPAKKATEPRGVSETLRAPG